MNGHSVRFSIITVDIENQADTCGLQYETSEGPPIVIDVPVAWSEALLEELQAVDKQSCELYTYPGDNQGIVPTSESVCSVLWRSTSDI